MKRLGVFVGDNGTWTFFSEIFTGLQSQFYTDVFSAPRSKVPLASGRLNAVLANRRVAAMLRRNDVCFFEWASELLVLATQRPKIGPIVTRFHSYELNVWAPRVHWPHVDRVVFVSETMRRRFLERFPALHDRTDVVFNGVNLERFTPRTEPGEGLTLGLLGWLHPVKRVYEAVLAVRKMRQTGHTVHLHIGGSEVTGGYFDDYAISTRGLVEKLGLSEHVTFHGRVTDTPGWLRSIDVFISNSYWEGQQVSLLEALASGCHCLSHVWDGAEEVLPARYLFASEDDLVERVREYHELTAEKKRRCRLEARAIAEAHFDIAETTRRIARTLHAVSRGELT